MLSIFYDHVNRREDMSLAFDLVLEALTGNRDRNCRVRRVIRVRRRADSLSTDGAGRNNHRN